MHSPRMIRVTVLAVTLLVISSNVFDLTPLAVTDAASAPTRSLSIRKADHSVVNSNLALQPESTNVAAATNPPSDAPAATPPPATSAPSVQPTTSPIVDASASPSHAQSPSPTDPTKAAGPTDLDPGATEIVAARTDRSQTYDNHDGTRTSLFYPEPVFYQAPGQTKWDPIDIGFAATSGGSVDARSDKSPVAVAIADSTATEFLSLTRGNQSISFHQTPAQLNKATLHKPTFSGPVADYSNFMPGVDLRVVANAQGAKSFFIWRSAPATSAIQYVVDAPGLTLSPQKDGSIALVDATGTTVAAIPRPYAVDSTADALAGSGRYTNLVSLSLGADGKTVTVQVDPGWLKTAAYPVFVDPSTGWVYNAGSSSYGDTFSASKYPGDNFANYARPDSPFYHELWNGTDPSGTSGTSYDFMRWDLSAIANTTIDSATLALDPYHQYYNSPTTETTYVRRVNASWTEGGLTWNNQPAYTTPTVSAGCVEATSCTWDVKSIVQLWTKGIGANSNYGFQVDTIGKGSTYWKRFISAEESGNSNRPKLSITYHNPAAPTSTTPPFAGSISWTPAVAQSYFHVDVATTSAFTTIVANSGDVSGNATSWLIQPTSPTSMTDDAVYWYRVKTFDGNSWSTFASASFTYDAYQRGDESYYVRTPFDLSGGWTLDVGAANGEASLSRSFFRIPSFGPSQALGMTYSSSGPTTAGMLGAGWSSNLTQYLSFENGLAVWHRPDGGRVAFAAAGGAAYGAHFESLAVGATDVVTLKDQTTLTFQASAPGRLLSITNRFGKALTLTWGSASATAIDASGRTTTLTIDAANGRITDVADSVGRHWTLGYVGTSTGSDLSFITEPDPDGAGSLPAPSSSFTYANHELVSISRLRSKAAVGTDQVTWGVGYDTMGRVSTVTDPLGAQASPVAANTFTYTAATTSTPMKADVGLVQAYSPIARLTAHHTLDGAGRPTSIQDPANWTTTQTFDPKGNLLTVVRPVDTVPNYGTTTYTYDAKGNILSETSPLTSSTSVTTVMSYNPTNDLLTRSQADSDAVVKVVTLNTFDAAGHLTSTIENCTSSGSTPPTPASSCTGAGTHDATTNLTQTYVYTSNDQVDVEWDALGIATKHLYDSSGYQTAVIVDCTATGTTIPPRGTSCTAAGTRDASTNVTTGATYDSSVGGRIGLATSTSDPIGNVTTDTYDTLGRVSIVVRPTDSTIPQLTTTTSYDEFGEVLSTADSWPSMTGGSRVTTSVYDYLGRVTSETGSAPGTSTTHSYDAAGNETQSVVGGVTTNRSNFDLLGNAATEATAPGTVDEIDTTRTFDPLGNKLTESSNGTTTTWTYDFASRVITQRDNITGATTTHHYDSLDRETSTDTSGSGSSSTIFDRDGRTTRTTDPAGLKVDTTYDADGNPLSVTHPYGGSLPAATDTATFDLMGRSIVNVVNYVSGGSGPDENLTTSTTYDAAGQAVAVKDPTGSVTLNVFNVRGLVAKLVVNCVDQPPPANWWQCSGAGTRTSTNNITTTTTFDGSGTALATVEVRVAPPNATTTSVLDAAGRLIATQDPRGAISRLFYDASGNLYKTVTNCVDSSPPTNWWDCAGTAPQDGTRNVTTVDTFDAAGRKATEVAPNGRLTTFTYDEAGHLLKVVDNDVPTPSQPDQDVTTEYHYDSLGRQDAMKDASGRVTYNHFDTTTGFLAWTVTGCLDATTPANWWQCTGTATADYQTNLKTMYAYDVAGRKIAVTSPAPSAIQSDVTTKATTEYAYDTNGRLCRVLEVASAGIVLQNLADPCLTVIAGTTTTNISTRYAYDDNGNVTSMTDAAGHPTSYGYDKNGNMTSLTDADGHTLVWTLDAQGHRLTQTNRSTGSVTWTYDEAGRQITRTADGITVTHGYDLNGNQTSVGTGPQTITTTYDALNRPTVVADSTDAAAGTTYTYGLLSGTRTDPSSGVAYLFTLDKFGREIGMIDPIHGAGSPWATTYAADGQPLSLVAPNGNTTSNGYDPVGRLKTMTTTAVGPVTRAAYTYSYNAAGQRLTENSQISGDPANGTATFGYDAIGRVTSYSGVPGINAGAYGFDKVPNRITKQVGAGPTVTATFDAANRPTGDSAGGVYVADLDGRITTRPLAGGTSESLGYDSIGRLTSATVAGVVTTYTYDPLDRPVTITRGTNVSKLRFIGTTTTIAQVRDGSNIVRYNLATSLAGDPRFDYDASGASQRFYGANGHRDVTWTANAAGNIVTAERYDPWGVGYVTIGSSVPDLRYQGGWYDSNSALSWFVNRWYAPELGTFTSEDPSLGNFAEPTTRHLYAYGGGDPIGRWDADGTSWCDYVHPCSYLYHGHHTSYWSHNLRNPNHIGGYFIMDEFIQSKWVDAPGTSGLKGDWRPFRSGGDCWEARACVVLNFDYGIAYAVVRPTCDKRSEWTYKCFDANAINTWLPLNNAVNFSESVYGIVDINWSLNQSATWGLVPINGSLHIVPPGAKSTPTRFNPAKLLYPEVRISGDGYPSVGLYYTHGSFFRTIVQKPEGDPSDLLPFKGDWTRTYAWPRPHR